MSKHYAPNNLADATQLKQYLAEELLLETYINNPNLKFIDQELTIAASDPRTKQDQFVELVQHCLGRHLSPLVFESLSWDYIASVWWNADECEEGRKQPIAEFSI